jgi:hypothetical protein
MDKQANTGKIEKKKKNQPKEKQGKQNCKDDDSWEKANRMLAENRRERWR